MKNLILHISLLVLILFDISAQNNRQQLCFTNPLNLNYRFQLDSPSRREAADPVVVPFKGKYYLFASKSGGYWSSTNLVNWKFITTNDLPLEDYAPAALVMDDEVYFMALDRRIYKSGNPDSGVWTVAKDSFDMYAGDPCLFLDDDNRLYLYHGLSNSKPIKGIELDRKTFNPIGENVNFFSGKPTDFGWERTGDYNTEFKKPFLEGAWMTKYQNKYYLQYSAPGTQYKSYADGVYVSNSPLGPFNLADTNPFSYKPEGFVCGAGHSNTFQDKYGNYWRAVTMTVAVKHRFERRIGLFPAFFDKDGEFYSYTGYGDFPHRMPTKKINSWSDYQPAGMLLSYNKPMEVSSELLGYPKENAANENIQNYWSAATGNKGEYIKVDLEQTCGVNSVQINFADHETTNLGRTDSIYHQYLLEYSNDNKNWKILADRRNTNHDTPHEFVELKSKVNARYIKLTNYRVPSGKFAVSGLRIFGNAKGKLPQIVESLSAVRDSNDTRNVVLKWEHSGATEYTIRYGTSPDKLYLNYQVLNKNSLIIHSLNKLKNYYFAIDAFNESGITRGNKVVEATINDEN